MSVSPNGGAPQAQPVFEREFQYRRRPLFGAAVEPREVFARPLRRIQTSEAAEQLSQRQLEDVAHRKLAAALLKVQQHEEDYKERTVLVYEALALAARTGLACGIRFDPVEGPEWPVVVIQLPQGEVAWHCAAYPGAYDGYTTAQKYERIEAYAAATNV